ncbi:DUF7331 family protein [Halosimplex carlsbadense]|uniref:DUF7331 family protein n=1 Tax=Halosimplex carlsbadense TaxID=171164 RepID=UPI001376DEE8|nr:hypothetical protein [Halosimplex carlsbadense]
MSVTDEAAEYQTVGTDSAELQRYDDVTLEEGKVLIYDQEDETAWIQSTSAIELEFMT